MAGDSSSPPPTASAETAGVADVGVGGLDVGFLDDGAAARDRLARRRTQQGFAVSAAVTAAWVVGVTASGGWGRVGDHLVASATMVVGSFVAGATPQGGGAVAFPVFTKVLDVPAETARSFSLCIQAIGMSCASAAIVLGRRPVVWSAVALGAPTGIAAFVVTLFVAGDRSAPFWPSDLPGPYVKLTFTLVVAAMGWAVLVGLRTPIRSVAGGLPAIEPRLRIALVVAGLLGGTASALVGSGADVFMYLFVVVLFGVRAGIGVPTSVVTMAIVSVAGFVVLGLLDGQLRITFDAAGAVTAVGGEVLAVPLSSRRGDLYGMWLAAVPVVAWGAPLGAFVASRMSSRALVTLALTVAVAEVVSTVVFLDQLRTDPVLAVYGLVGLVVAIGGVMALAANRHRLFGLPPVDLSTQLTRSSVEAAPDYQRRLSKPTASTSGRTNDEESRGRNS
ncbi:MAG: sulfite exporter TauE/SafE family protein [Actinomycetota bacterium]